MVIYIRLKHHFSMRLTEWMIATITTLSGVTLLAATNTYDSSPVFNFVRHFVSQEVLGTIMLFFGILRLAALTVNGTRQDVTPTLRTVAAFVGFMLWTFLCFSFVLSGVISLWAGTYPVIAAFELVNMYRAAHDAGAYRARTT